MTHLEGHDPGHALHLIDAFSWREYVFGLVKDKGSWRDLVDNLQNWARERHREISMDPQTVEKGLRRLAQKTGPGDSYGKLLIDAFGMPSCVEQWGRLMGQYHSRFADLPVGLRRQQLLRWNRPPVSESPVAAWVHVALASLAHRSAGQEGGAQRIAIAIPVGIRLKKTLATH